jgi:antitoxin CptB
VDQTAQADPSGRLLQAQPIAPEALRRLRWRARRGLLENDLLIGCFLDRQGEALEAASAEALGRLLDLSEAELLDLLLERQQLAGQLDAPAVHEVLAQLRSIRLEPRLAPLIRSTSGA